VDIKRIDLYLHFAGILLISFDVFTADVLQFQTCVARAIAALTRTNIPVNVLTSGLEFFQLSLSDRFTGIGSTIATGIGSVIFFFASPI
jgi:hypothetical protein